MSTIPNAPGFGPLTALHVVRDTLFLVVAEGDAAFDVVEGRHSHLYEPITLASTLNEALEAAREDFANRLKRVEAGEEVAHPEAYAVWGRDAQGQWVRLEEVVP